MSKCTCKGDIFDKRVSRTGRIAKITIEDCLGQILIESYPSYVLMGFWKCTVLKLSDLFAVGQTRDACDPE